MKPPLYMGQEENEQAAPTPDTRPSLLGYLLGLLLRARRWLEARQ